MGRYWIVIYLWVKDLKFFFNNLSVVVCWLKFIEKRLEKVGLEYSKVYGD